MSRRSLAFAAAPPGHAALIAIFWMIGAAFFFSILSAIIRHLTNELHPLEIAFFRNLFGLVFMLPWLAKAGFGSLRTGRFGLYLWRTTVGLLSMFAWFWALALLPFAQAVALSFTTPLFATMGAALILKERVRLRRWTATLAGFVGVLGLWTWIGAGIIAASAIYIAHREALHGQATASRSATSPAAMPAAQPVGADRQAD